MARSTGISGVGVGMAAAGALLMYAGIRDVAVLQALREVTGGTLPEGNKAAEGQPTAAVTAAQAALKGTAAGGVTSAVPATATGGSSSLAQAALRYRGVPYRWGGTTSSGLDCSGLVQLAFGDIGIKAPRTTYQQQAWRAVTRITAAQATTGDLVFWPGHVAIMVSPGMVIHAPRPGKVVQVVPVGSAGPRGTTATYRRYGAAAAGTTTKPKSAQV